MATWIIFLSTWIIGGSDSLWVHYWKKCTGDPDPDCAGDFQAPLTDLQSAVTRLIGCTIMQMDRTSTIVPVPMLVWQKEGLRRSSLSGGHEGPEDAVRNLHYM
eukprot:366464-Chlamydomonas_euryale.AAC.7